MNKLIRTDYSITYFMTHEEQRELTMSTLGILEFDLRDKVNRHILLSFLEEKGFNIEQPIITEVFFNGINYAQYTGGE